MYTSVDYACYGDFNEGTNKMLIYYDVLMTFLGKTLKYLHNLPWRTGVCIHT